MSDLPSCQSALDLSEASDVDETSFSKTPIRVDDDDASIASDISSDSSGGSVHFNERGDRTYFHVWSDMLTCDEMNLLDSKAETELPNYVEGDEINNPNIHKPLSIDTSLPCPLIQFGPIPKRCNKVAAKTENASETVDDSPTKSNFAGDIVAKNNDEAALNVSASLRQHQREAENENDEASDGPGCSAKHGHDERCCDFSLVAEKNNARRKMEAKQRRLERKRLVRN